MENDREEKYMIDKDEVTRKTKTRERESALMSKCTTWLILNIGMTRGRHERCVEAQEKQQLAEKQKNSSSNKKNGLTKDF